MMDEVKIDEKVRNEILSRAMGTAFQMDIMWLLKDLDLISSERNYWRFRAEKAEAECGEWKERAEDAEGTLWRIEKMFDDMVAEIRENRGQNLEDEAEELDDEFV